MFVDQSVLHKWGSGPIEGEAHLHHITQLSDSTEHQNQFKNKTAKCTGYGHKVISQHGA